MTKESESTAVAVRFSNVRKSFVERGQSTEVLKGITGEVPQGALLTMVGPSGSGKSTLLSLCNLLLDPDEGEVEVFGREVRKWSIPELRKTVGMVFQAPTLFPGSVLDNLCLGPNLRGEKVKDPGYWLEAVDLPRTLAERSVEDLSGGQRQRIALIRTLINEPSILLLDEVTSALDPASTQIVETLIADWRQRSGATVLWVTHHLEQAKRLGDLTWYLEAGELVEAGPTAELFANPSNEKTRAFIRDGEPASAGVKPADSKDESGQDAGTEQTGGGERA